MTDCIPLEELAQVADLPANDSRRRHLDTCARCRAAWLQYADFLAPGPGFESDRERAAAALDATIAALGAPPRRRRAAWPLLVPMAAAAALAVLLLDAREPALPPVGAPAAIRGTAASGAIRLDAPLARPDGSVMLRWSSLPGAVAYRVRVLASSGVVVWESAEIPDTSLVLGPDALPGGTTLAWRVAARTVGGDEALSVPADLVTGGPGTRRHDP